MSIYDMNLQRAWYSNGIMCYIVEGKCQTFMDFATGYLLWFYQIDEQLICYNRSKDKWRMWKGFILLLLMKHAFFVLPRSISVIERRKEGAGSFQKGNIDHSHHCFVVKPSNASLPPQKLSFDFGAGASFSDIMTWFQLFYSWKTLLF